MRARPQGATNGHLESSLQRTTAGAEQLAKPVRLICCMAQASMDALTREASRLRADGEYAQRKLDWLAAQAEAAEERARDAELAAAAAAAAAAKQACSCLQGPMTCPGRACVVNMLTTMSTHRPGA